jgi:hypothetical protein
MTAMTPMKKLLRVGKTLYTVDMAGHELKIGTCDTAEIAHWTAYALAGWHKVSLEEREE